MTPTHGTPSFPPGAIARLAPADWLTGTPTRTVMAALNDPHSDQTRFVGGCVRNALIGAGVGDVDLATIHPPDAVIARLEGAGLKAVGTGIAHGTVTGIAHGRPFEITTLRRDVATDGRRAVVAFTQDWAEDARRRDFTLNALYADARGRVFDPLEGFGDLRARRVRFIGNARLRLREDYLRALRFFRMHAWYGAGPFDPDGLAAVEAERNGLGGLSGERIHREMLKLLEADDPVPALEAMGRIGVLDRLIPCRAQGNGTAAVIEAERAFELRASGIRRLAGLVLGASSAQISALASRWRLSKAQTDRLMALADRSTIPAAELLPERLAETLYRRGADRTRDALVLARARGDLAVGPAIDSLGVIERWSPPRFPLTGRDLIAAGLSPGPDVGRILAQLEAIWVTGGFREDREALLRRFQTDDLTS